MRDLFQKKALGMRIRVIEFDIGNSDLAIITGKLEHAALYATR